MYKKFKIACLISSLLIIYAHINIHVEYPLLVLTLQANFNLLINKNIAVY